MTNVLPVPAQKKLWRMYRARFILALSALMFGLALLSGLLLVPSYLALQLAAPPAVSANVAHPAPGVDSATEIGRAQALVRSLSPLLTATTSPTSIIAAALAQRPAGLVIEHVTYAADTYNLTLTGTGSRDSINAYRDTLSKDKTYSSVSVPVSALVGTDGGSFSMTLTLTH